MADTLTRYERSKRMRLIRSRGTRPEAIVRKLLSSSGFRYRLHSKILPGHPDIVLAGRAKVIFVHGCFWHRHRNCRLARLPKSKLDYWVPKLEANRKRDTRNRKALKRLGWNSLVVWECELTDPKRLSTRLSKCLGRRKKVKSGKRTG